jgi:hypothetical protein
MKKCICLYSLIFFCTGVFAQTDTGSAHVIVKKEDKALKFNLNDDGSHFFQITFLNQTWLRENQSNPGTTVLGEGAPWTFDIGLRRTRIQMFGQITDRAFLYFQFGQNNFNALYTGQGSNNRIIAAYFHDALGEYRLSNKNQLKIGAGLTIANGLSRFSNPSVGTIMALDLPVFAQATVNATDQFSRKLSVYARGQIGKIDYRLVLSDPFSANQSSSGSSGLTSLAGNLNVANFAARGHKLQQQAYVMYQFLEHEGHNTPYMTGSYLGKKKVFNIAAGVIYQKNAMWKKTGAAIGDTAYQDMILWAVESFMDTPLNKDKGTALTAYAGYFNTNYGSNYIRTQQQMNPADANAKAPFSNSVSKGGNGWPMFGTGQVIYAQAGYLMKRDLLGSQGTLQPYVCYQMNLFKALADPVNIYDVGLNWLMNGHKSKLSIDYQSRNIFNNISVADPTGARPETSGRRGCVIMQYQIYI